MTAGIIRREQEDEEMFAEAALLHMRILLEFFVGRSGGRHKGDFWPTDLAPGWQDPVDEAFAVLNVATTA